MTKKVLAPKKVKCDRRKGKFYLPETEIEVPKDLAGIVYPLKAIRINPANPRKTLDPSPARSRCDRDQGTVANRQRLTQNST